MQLRVVKPNIVLLEQILNAISLRDITARPKLAKSTLHLCKITVVAFERPGVVHHNINSSNILLALKQTVQSCSISDKHMSARKGKWSRSGGKAKGGDVDHARL